MQPKGEGEGGADVKTAWDRKGRGGMGPGGGVSTVGEVDLVGVRGLAPRSRPETDGSESTVGRESLQRGQGRCEGQREGVRPELRQRWTRTHARCQPALTHPSGTAREERRREREKQSQTHLEKSRWSPQERERRERGRGGRSSE